MTLPHHELTVRGTAPTVIERGRFLRWIAGWFDPISAAFVSLPLLHAVLSPTLIAPTADAWATVADDTALVDNGLLPRESPAKPEGRPMKKLEQILGMVLFALVAIALSAVSARAQDADGKTLYDTNCKKCHGVRGVPPKAMQTKFPKLAAFDAAFVAKNSKDEIVAVLTKGGKSADMKSFKDKLTPAQMAAVAAYVHQLSAAPGSE